MRPMGADESAQAPLSDSKLPPLWMTLVPILLPVLMVSFNTVPNTLAMDATEPSLLIRWAAIA